MPLPTEANTTRPEAQGYDLLIEYGDTDAESLYLRTAVGPGRTMRFETVEPQVDGINTQANPEDMRSETGRTFSRSNFTGGEGLDRAHRRDGTDFDYTRYWDSKNIDVTPARQGEAEEIKLLKSASALRSMAAGTDRGTLVRAGTRLYAMCNSATAVDYTDDPTASSPTWNQFTTGTIGSSGDIADIAVLGDELYVARAAIRVRASGGTWSEYSSLDADRIWAAKGRVIAAVGAALYEAGASDTLLHTLPSGQTWNDVVDAGAAILAAASDGLIYAFAEQNGELILRNQSTLGGDNTFEIPTALGAAQGLVFVGTSEATTGGGAIGRLYRGVLVGLRLRELQVIREWGDGSTTVDRAPRRIVGTRESVYTGVIEDSSETHMWRYHLETGGISRDLVFNLDGLVHGIAVFDDRVFATVFGEDLFREDTTYASTGYLISPLADFYDASRKTWIGARLEPSNLPTGTDATLYYSTDPDALEDPDHASWTSVIAMDENTATTSYSAETAITEVQSRYIAAKIVLTPNGASTATPTILAFAFRAVPIPTEQDFQIPLNMSDRIERPGRKPILVPGAGDAVYDQIQTILGQSATVTALRTGEVLVGQLRGLSSPIQEIPERGEARVYSLLTVRGQRQ